MKSSCVKFLLLALLLGLTLTDCGRRGPPVPPGPASAVTYPQTYPAQ